MGKTACRGIKPKNAIRVITLLAMYKVRGRGSRRRPGKVRRGIKVKTHMIVLHVVSPSPTQADHGDMAERIARGEFELPA